MINRISATPVAKRVRMAWVAVLVLGLLSASVMAAEYSGGSGTQGDPYQIATVADWTTLSETPDDWNKHFLLTQDIDFEGASLTPVGNSSTSFTGIFDGGVKGKGIFK